MKILFLSLGDPHEKPLLWSGTALQFIKIMEAKGHEVQVVSLPEPKVELLLRLKRKFFYKLFKRGFLFDFSPLWRRSQKKFLEKALKGVEYDVMFSWLPWLTNLVDTNKPRLFWYDTTFTQTHPIYYQRLLKRNLADAIAIDKDATLKANAAIYSTNWSCESSVKDYGNDPSRVHMIPFGANLHQFPTDEEVQQAIDRRVARHDGVIRLLFVGMDWKRKGGDIAIEVARRLHKSGHKVKLTMVGGTPDITEEDKAYVDLVGMLYKKNPADWERFRQLFLNSDFFIMTSRGDSSPIVYCEAFAHGLPCLAASTGGVSTIVRTGETGKLAEWGDNISDELADFVVKTRSDDVAYRALCESTFRLSHTLFNWDAAKESFEKVLQKVAKEGPRKQGSGG